MRAVRSSGQRKNNARFGSWPNAIDRDCIAKKYHYVRFPHFGTQHWLILFLTAVAPIVLIWWARRSQHPGTVKLMARSLGALLLLNYIAYTIFRIQSGYWEVRYDLPMEFCNWSTAVTVLALWTRNRTMAELSYFWVLAGSLNGVITPDLQAQFPQFYFFIFWIGHSGLVVAALFVVFGLRLPPRPGSLWRVIGYSQLYFVCAMGVNYLVNGNYGYLSHKPGGASVLDGLGDWPYYILSMQAVAIVLFAILYAPFYLINRGRAHD